MRIPYFSHKQLSPEHCLTKKKKIFLINGSNLIILDAKTFNLLNTINFDADLFKLQIIKDDIYVLTHASKISRINMQTGKIKQIPTPSPVMDITCFNGVLFALTHNFDLFAMKNGSVMWKQDGVRQMRYCVGNVIEQNGYILGSLKPNVISVLDGRSGQVLSEHIAPYSLFYKLIKHNKKLYCVTDKVMIEFDEHFKVKDRKNLSNVQGVTSDMIFFDSTKLFDKTDRVIYKTEQKIDNAFANKNGLVVMGAKNTFILNKEGKVLEKLPAGVYVLDNGVRVEKGACKISFVDKKEAINA